MTMSFDLSSLLTRLMSIDMVDLHCLDGREITLHFKIDLSFDGLHFAIGAAVDHGVPSSEVIAEEDFAALRLNSDALQHSCNETHLLNFCIYMLVSCSVALILSCFYLL